MPQAEPLDEIQWKSPEWIQQFGLHNGNVLDYFSESPFYDRTSNNQVLKMQFQFQAIPPGVHPQQYLQSKLVDMVGVEFTVAYVKEPDFWIVRKQKRLGPSSVVVQQDYYIVGANVYQAPKIYDILSSRLLSSINSVKSSLDILNGLSTYSIANGGHSYPSANDAQKPAGGAPGTAGATGAGGAGAAASVGISMDDGITSTASTGAANTATPMVSTPSITVAPGTVGAVPNTVANSNTNLNTTNVGGATLTNNNALNNISSATFDGLLGQVVGSNDQGTYLDDIPYYGKGSTVEKLDLKINLEED